MVFLLLVKDRQKRSYGMVRVVKIAMGSFLAEKDG